MWPYTDEELDFINGKKKIRALRRSFQLTFLQMYDILYRYYYEQETT